MGMEVLMKINRFRHRLRVKAINLTRFGKRTGYKLRVVRHANQNIRVIGCKGKNFFDVGMYVYGDYIPVTKYYEKEQT